VVSRNKQELYFSICSQWEIESKLNLEYVDYQKMVIRDVNNYQAIDVKGKVKHKGCFELNDIGDPQFVNWNKDLSFRIVPVALDAYFVKGISIKETIMNHDDIFDFCGRAKFKSDSRGEYRFLSKGTAGEENLDKNGEIIQFNNDITLVSEIQQKTTRYYISKRGGLFYKVFHKKGTENIIQKGYLCKMANVIDINKPIEEYGINYQFYIDECEKIIAQVEPRQLKFNLDNITALDEMAVEKDRVEVQYQLQLDEERVAYTLVRDD